MTFTNKESDVLNLLLSLSDSPDFKDVKQLESNSVEVTYDGGYNNVYNHTCVITIIECKPIYDKFFWWTFNIKSVDTDYDIDSDTFTGCLSFMDFFIDDYIKQIGNRLYEF
jgi:hypothetical protein